MTANLIWLSAGLLAGMAQLVIRLRCPIVSFTSHYRVSCAPEAAAYHVLFVGMLISLGVTGVGLVIGARLRQPALWVWSCLAIVGVVISIVRAFALMATY